jgi:hypothetical protein
MRFDRSAGLFVTGAWLAIGGSAVSLVGIASMNSSSSSPYSSAPDGFSVMLTLLAAAAAIAGSVLIAVAMYRALCKIDAMVVPATQPQAAAWRGQHLPPQAPSRR